MGVLYFISELISSLNRWTYGLMKTVSIVKTNLLVGDQLRGLPSTDYPNWCPSGVFSTDRRTKDSVLVCTRQVDFGLRLVIFTFS